MSAVRMVAASWDQSARHPDERRKCVTVVWRRAQLRERFHACGWGRTWDSRAAMAMSQGHINCRVYRPVQKLGTRVIRSAPVRHGCALFRWIHVFVVVNHLVDYFRGCHYPQWHQTQRHHLTSWLWNDHRDAGNMPRLHSNSMNLPRSAWMNEPAKHWHVYLHFLFSSRI